MHQLFFSSDLSPAANIQYILLKIFFNELFFILFLSKDRFSFEVRNSFCDVGPVKQNVTGGLHYINVSSQHTVVDTLEYSAYSSVRLWVSCVSSVVSISADLLLYNVLPGLQLTSVTKKNLKCIRALRYLRSFNVFLSNGAGVGGRMLWEEPQFWVILSVARYMK